MQDNHHQRHLMCGESTKRTGKRCTEVGSVHGVSLIYNEVRGRMHINQHLHMIMASASMVL
jgi:hypothetical protein